MYFRTKKTYLGKFWKVLQWKILVFFMALLSILRPIVIFYGHLVHFVDIWYVFPRFWYVVPRKIWQPCSVDSLSIPAFTQDVWPTVLLKRCLLSQVLTH
jgi:hypothetical protein